MQKEILTKEQCLKDVKNHYRRKSGFIDYLIFIIFALSVSVMMLLFLFTRSPLSLLMIIIPIMAIAVYIYTEKKKATKITPDRIVIREYRCNQITEDITHRPNVHSFDSGLKYIMYFDGCDRYVLPRRNYEWSKLYSMSDKTVNMTTLEGDTFIVAFLDEDMGRPMAVYNTKLFEYKEHG